MSDDLRSQIESLQTQVAFQEDTIEQLNLALTDQQMQLEKINFHLKQIVQKVKQMEPSNMADASQETPPPHY